MPLKRIAKFSIISTSIILCALIAAYCYFFYSYMPDHFQREILPGLMREAGIKGFTGKVKSVGAFGANLGELTIGDPENPAMKVRSVIIKYRFQNIFMPTKPDITSIDFNGLELMCKLEKDRFEINDIDVGKFVEQLKAHFSGKHEKAVGSWSKTKLKITDGLIHLDCNGTRLLLPFELVFHPEKSNWELFKADLNLSWRDNPVNARLLVDMKSKTSQIKFKAHAEMKKLLDLLMRSRPMEELSKLKLKGDTDINGIIICGFEPWKLNEMVISGSSRDCEVKYGTVLLTNHKKTSGVNIPLRITITSKGKGYSVSVENALASKPFNVFIRDLSWSAPVNRWQPLKFVGEFEFDISRLKLAQYYRIRNESRDNLIRKMSGSYNRITQNWEFKTDEKGRYARKSEGKTLITYGDTKAFANIVELGFSGTGDRRSGNLEVALKLKDLSGSAYQSAFFCDEIDINSNLEVFPEPGGNLRIKKNYFELKSPKFFSSSPGYRMEINNLSVKGSNSFAGMEMNGFVLSAKSEQTSIARNGNSISSENNTVNLDGVFRKANKAWELSAYYYSDALTGKYAGNEINLLKVKNQNFLTLKDSLYKWTGIKSCNFRINCLAGHCQNTKKNMKFSKLEMATSLGFDDKMRLKDKTFSGSIDKFELAADGCNFFINKLEAGAEFNQEARKNSERKKSNCQGSLICDSIGLAKGKVNYQANSLKFKLHADTYLKELMPKALNTELITPLFTVSKGKEVVRLKNSVLKTHMWFSKQEIDNDAWNALKSTKIDFKLDKISGDWNKMAVLAKKTSFKAESGVKTRDSKLFFDNIKALFNTEQLMAYTKSWKIASAGVNLVSTGQGPASEKIILNPNLKLKAFYFSSKDTGVNVPEVKIESKYADNDLSGTIVFDKAVFAKNNLGLSCKNISLRLPFGKNAPVGRMQVETMNLRKNELGQINAKLQFKDNDLIIKASHFSDIFANASVFMQGKMNFTPLPEWQGDFFIPEFKMKNPLSAGMFFPNKNIGFRGYIAAEGKVKGNLNTCTSTGKVTMKKAKIYADSWELDGVDCVCMFEELFNAKSAPGQKLFCKKLKTANSSFADMKLNFDLLGLKKVKVNQVSSKWFGGSLTGLAPFVLDNYVSSPAKVNFLAANVTLSPLLNYLGVKHFSTDAFVGGIIPISFKDEKIYFSKASLATKTSKRGFLRLDGKLTNYDLSDADYSQISRKNFMTAALKRFNYNWIRLNFSSSPKQSDITLSVDGFPAKAVPFKYDKETDMYNPTAPDEPGINGDMTIETNFIIPAK